MLMDAALTAINNAVEGFEIRHPVRRNELIHNNLEKAQQVISVLQAALDMEVEGEFPRQMNALYEFMLNELSQANLSKAPEPAVVVRGLLHELRDAWSEMLTQQMSGSEGSRTVLQA
jgi:flagellar protein FliS